MRRFFVIAAALPFLTLQACSNDNGSGPAGPLTLQITSAPDSLLRSEEPKIAGGVIDAKSHAVAGRHLTWKSLNESVLTVDSLGYIHPVALGATRVVVSSGDLTDTTGTITVYATYSVGTNAPEAGLALTTGQTQTLTPTMTDDMDNTIAGRTFTWTSENETVARVSANGTVTAVAPGTTTITVSSVDPNGETQTADVTVKVTAPVPTP